MKSIAYTSLALHIGASKAFHFYYDASKTPMSPFGRQTSEPRGNHASSWMPSSDAPQNQDDEEEEEQVEPGNMRVSEIKAELDMRGISYNDCFDKMSLAVRLKEARLSGIANPKLLDKFNKQRLEDTFSGRKPVAEVLTDDDLLNQAVGSDGNLPGGLSPDQFKELIQNPDIMRMLQSSKMQEAMKLVMAGDQQKLESTLSRDPELRDIMKKLQSILGGPSTDD